jgi:hypothetical protein
MAVKKNTYVSAELDWAEAQLDSWKSYVDANPLHELEDRIKWKETKAGGAMPMVIASIEAQGKFVQETMKNYLALLEQVDKLREKEEAKTVAVRGDVQLGSMAEEFLKGRN